MYELAAVKVETAEDQLPVFTRVATTDYPDLLSVEESALSEQDAA